MALSRFPYFYLSLPSRRCTVLFFRSWSCCTSPFSLVSIPRVEVDHHIAFRVLLSRRASPSFLFLMAICLRLGRNYALPRSHRAAYSSLCSHVPHVCSPYPLMLVCFTPPLHRSLPSPVSHFLPSISHARLPLRGRAFASILYCPIPRLRPPLPSSPPPLLLPHARLLALLHAANPLFVVRLSVSATHARTRARTHERTRPHFTPPPLVTLPAVPCPTPPFLPLTHLLIHLCPPDHVRALLEFLLLVLLLPSSFLSFPISCCHIFSSLDSFLPLCSTIGALPCPSRSPSPTSLTSL